MARFAPRLRLNDQWYADLLFFSRPRHSFSIATRRRREPRKRLFYWGCANPPRFRLGISKIGMGVVITMFSRKKRVKNGMLIYEASLQRPKYCRHDSVDIAAQIARLHL